MRRRALFTWVTGLFAALFDTRRAARALQRPDYPPPIPPERRAQFDKLRAQTRAALSYTRVEVPGERALIEWEKLKSAGRGWPVIVGGDEQLDAIAEQLSINGSIDAATSAATSTSPAAILKEAAALNFPESLNQWFGADADLPEPPLGEWPEHGMAGSAGLTIASDIRTGKPLDRVHILLIPTTNSWEVPAYLRWGGWNACPPPAQQVAALRYWHQRFGVELVAVDRDTINLRGARRPIGRPAALALARQQYQYCPDVIDQGAGSLSALAASLMADDWWFFWWD